METLLEGGLLLGRGEGGGGGGEGGNSRAFLLQMKSRLNCSYQ